MALSFARCCRFLWVWLWLLRRLLCFDDRAVVGAEPLGLDSALWLSKSSVCMVENNVGKKDGMDVITPSVEEQSKNET